MPAIDDTARLPQLAGPPHGHRRRPGNRPDFHHGVDLPLFAAFPLIDTAGGRSLLTGYYAGHGARRRVRRGRRRHLAGPARLDRHRGGRVGRGPGAAAGYAAAAGDEIARRITWQQQDLRSWDPGPQRFDLVSAQFMHLSRAELEAMHGRLQRAARPCGRAARCSWCLTIPMTCQPRRP